MVLWLEENQRLAWWTIEGRTCRKNGKSPRRDDDGPLSDRVRKASRL